MKKLIFLAILLRFLVMPFFFHPDIKTTYFQTSFLKQGVWNIYDYLLEKRNNLPLKEEFVYQPLTYLFLGSYQAIASPFLGKGFDSWLWDASQGVVARAGTYRYLFMMKLPYLVLDLLMALALAACFKEQERKKKAVVLWLFNPFSLVLVYLFSNIDVLPVYLTVVSLLLAGKNKLIASAVVLGIAAGVKVYPLLLLPFLLLKSKSVKEALGVVLAPLILLVITVAPFWSKAYQTSALVSGLTMRMVQGGISLGFGESLYPAVIGLIVVYLVFLSTKKIPLENVILILVLMLFSFIHYHIQWLLWAAPFAIIIWVKRAGLRQLLLLIALLAFSIPLLYNDKFMGASLFVPISSLFSLVPTPFAIIQKFFDPYVIQGILHSALAGVSLVLGLELLHLRGGRTDSSDGGLV